MRVVFAIVAVSLLSTSAYARECYKLSWAERGECHRTDPTYPVRYEICANMLEERGWPTGHYGHGLFSQCVHTLSPLGMQELIGQGPRLARGSLQRHSVVGWGLE
jgi:hypothetical protein